MNPETFSCCAHAKFLTCGSTLNNNVSGAAHGLRRPTAPSHRSLARQGQQGADEAPQRLASEGPQQWTAAAEGCGPRATDRGTAERSGPTDPNGSGTGTGSTDPNGCRTEGNGRNRPGSAS